MAYVPTLWEDGITPVDAANMNKIEAELAALDAGGGGASLTYEGDYVPATEYQDGDTVVSDGIVWLCVGGPTTTPPDPTLWGSLSPGEPAAGIPADVVVASGSPLITNRFAAGDANPAFRLMAQGQMWFGPGGAGVEDVSLYRLQAGVLKVGGHLAVSGYMDVDRDGGGGQLRFGSAMDTNLYRNSAGILATDGQFYLRGAGSYLAFQAPGDTAAKFYISANGYHSWGTGAAGGDTVLYRSAAGTLKTGGMLDAGTGFLARGTGASWTIRVLKDAEAAYRFGVDANGVLLWDSGAAGTYDVSLFRGGAGQLRTNASLQIAGRLTLRNDGAGGDIIFGGDTNLYRSAAGTLKTDGQLSVGGTFNALASVGVTGSIFAYSEVVFQPRASASVLWYGSVTGDPAMRVRVDANGKMSWGDGTTWPGDTNLYRVGAGTLQTDSTLVVAGNILLQTAGNRMFFGPANDTNLYRSAAGFLKTDGWLGVGNAAAKPATGDQGIAMANLGIAITGTPVGGGWLYALNGALVWKGSSGTVTVIGPA